METIHTIITIHLKMSLCLIFGLLKVSSILHAQTAPKIEWQRCIGGKNAEDSNVIGIGGNIIKTNNGSLIICGNSASNDGDISGNHGAGDAWVAMLYPVGSLAWQKCYGGSLLKEASYNSGFDQASRITQTSDGGYVFAGSENSNNGDVIGHIGGIDSAFNGLFHYLQPDAWVVKVDMFGNIEWQSCLGGIASDWAISTIQTTDGGYVVVGGTESTNEEIRNHGGPIYDSLFPDGVGQDAYFVKLDASGRKEWERGYGGTGSDFFTSVLQTSDGYILAGGTNSKDGDVKGYHQNIDTGYRTYDIWIVKINIGGQIIWQKCFGGTGAEGLGSMIRTNDGAYILCGSTDSKNDGDVSGHHSGNDGSFTKYNTDVWVLKIDSIGNLLWQKCLGGSRSESASSIIQTSEGGYILTGNTTSNDGDVSGNHNNGITDSTDVWVVKLNSSGDIEWQKCLGGSAEDFGNDILQTSDGKFIVYGATKSNDGDVSGNHGSSDYWVVKLGLANSVESGAAPQMKYVLAYPNPSSNEFYLSLYDPESVKAVQFFNIMGMQVFPDYKIEASYYLHADTHTLPNGSYIVRITFNNPGFGTEVKKFLIYHQ